MPIQHKFIQKDFENGFATNNAILNPTPYKSEVLIVGTFNPGDPIENQADFFYDRNYFWPAFKKMGNPNDGLLRERRMPRNGDPILPLDPSEDEIFEICKKFKLTFADLILEVLHNGNPQYEIVDEKYVIYKNEKYNPVQDGKEKGILGLSQLNRLKEVEWNTKNIIIYLLQNPSIRKIYFTRQPKTLWLKQWEIIKDYPGLEDRYFSNILSPSGRGRIKKPKPPFDSPLNKILHYWVWNGMNHPFEPVNNDGFGHLDHEWLNRFGVDVNNF